MNHTALRVRPGSARHETSESLREKLAIRMLGHSGGSGNEVIVKICETIAARYRRRSEPGPGGVLAAFINVGSSAAAVGSVRIRELIPQEDLEGTKLFLQQISACAGEDQLRRSSFSFYEHRRSPLRDRDAPLEASAALTKRPALNTEADHDDGVSLYADAQSQFCVDIHGDEPYQWPDSDTVSIASHHRPEDPEMLPNVLGIEVLSTEGRSNVRMQALLDTGASANMITKTFADRTGFPIRPFSGSGPPVIYGASGEEVPIQVFGVVELQWHFSEFSPGKSHLVTFLVCPDSVPYDVVLGIRFLREARIFKLNESCMMLVTPGDRGSNKRKEINTDKRRGQKDKRREKEQDEAEQREAKQREAEHKEAEQEKEIQKDVEQEVKQQEKKKQKDGG